MDALAVSLQADARHGSDKKLADDFAHNPQALHSILKPMAGTSGAAQALFVVDQFEELFTLCRSEAEQTAFVENLLNAALQPRGNAVVIIVLRADFYAHCARFDLLRQALSQHQEYIGPMTVKELRRAIEEPARHGHWEFKSGLIEFLLHDVGADVAGRPRTRRTAPAFTCTACHVAASARTDAHARWLLCFWRRARRYRRNCRGCLPRPIGTGTTRNRAPDFHAPD